MIKYPSHKSGSNSSKRTYILVTLYSFSMMICIFFTKTICRQHNKMWTVFSYYGSNNDLLPTRCQAITSTNDGLLSIGHLGTNFTEISIKNMRIFIQENGFENVIYKMAAISEKAHFLDMHLWVSLDNYLILHLGLITLLPSKLSYSTLYCNCNSKT